MITPDFLDEIVLATEQRVSELHEYLIGRIANRIASYLGSIDDINLIPSSIKDLHKLIESGVVLEDIEREIIKRYPQIETEVKKAFYNSANEMRLANIEFERDVLMNDVPDAVIEDVPLQEALSKQLSPYEVKLLEANYKRTNGTIHNMTKTTAQSAQRAYINACDSAYFKVQHGVGINTAIMEAVEEVAEQGIGVVDFNGRVTKVETAISRAVRTGINQTNGEMVLAECGRMGVGYVVVSEHLGARVTKVNDYTNHSWWQGKVYKLNFNNPILSKFATADDEQIALMNETIGEVNPDYPDFIEACGYGDVQGICGANCRHSFSMFMPNIMEHEGQTIDPAENERRYNETQRARAMERAIRKTKRIIEGLKGTGLTNDPQIQKELQSKNALLERQLDAYRQYCKDHRLNADGSRLVIPKG